MTNTTQRTRAKNTLSHVEKVRQSYFNWLCEMVADVELTGDAQPLLFFLHTKDFYSKIPNDDNRAMDGQKLREQFKEDRNIEDEESLGGPCTVLEMLIALAYRADFIIPKSSNEEKLTAKLFWEMIDNLGLEIFGDCDRSESEELKKIQDETKLYRFLERDYSPSGRGGLFPLKRPSENQKHVEIWYQLMGYLDENYHLV